MKKISNTFPCRYIISKYKTLADAKQLLLLLYIAIATSVLLCIGNQHEELQIMYANLRV
ncbi:hypothetical protein E0W68_08270 [Flavobacterium salilacus subsp. salilacus]|uniref:hypothetical protein n=1 Tax=Flavobacterium TaxID=237 RepID=UPI001389439B|nr:MULTISPECIES: hypothetical protein [Flavobacterium]KAF2518737.1 hypothetical protein E0W68_08270 [Flavobacterium salilacus subsp. salilacus]MBE1613703.1 hypothetical protein [Flavobacterium sp. SaA2.13]NDI99056.1 hypothetical protein [Flavobacterium salilacus subsp. altitudinum]